MLKKGFPKEKS